MVPSLLLQLKPSGDEGDASPAALPIRGALLPPVLLLIRENWKRHVKGKELLSRRLRPPARWALATCSVHKPLEQSVVAGADVQAPMPAELPVH